MAIAVTAQTTVVDGVAYTTTYSQRDQDWLAEIAADGVWFHSLSRDTFESAQHNVAITIDLKSRRS